MSWEHNSKQTTQLPHRGIEQDLCMAQNAPCYTKHHYYRCNLSYWKSLISGVADSGVKIIHSQITTLLPLPCTAAALPGWCHSSIYLGIQIWIFSCRYRGRYSERSQVRKGSTTFLSDNLGGYFSC